MEDALIRSCTAGLLLAEPLAYQASDGRLRYRVLADSAQQPTVLMPVEGLECKVAHHLYCCHSLLVFSISFVRLILPRSNVCNAERESHDGLIPLTATRSAAVAIGCREYMTLEVHNRTTLGITLASIRH